MDGAETQLQRPVARHASGEQFTATIQAHNIDIQGTSTVFLRKWVHVNLFPSFNIIWVTCQSVNNVCVCVKFVSFSLH